MNQMNQTVHCASHLVHLVSSGDKEKIIRVIRVIRC